MIIGSNTQVSVTIDFTQEMVWDFQSCTPRFFQVTGTFVTDQIPPPQIGNCPSPFTTASSCPPCPSAFVVNIIACDPDEVCQKLLGRGFVRRISTIKAFPNAAFQNPLGPITLPIVGMPLPGNGPQSPVGVGQPITTNLIFNTNFVDPLGLMVDVTPSNSSCVNCCAFFIDEDLNSTAPTFCTQIGGLGVSSIAEHAIIPPSGEMIIGSKTRVSCSHYLYQGSGDMFLYPHFKVLNPVSHLYRGSGRMRMGGGASLGFAYNCSGKMRVAGKFKIPFNLGYHGSGLMIINGHARVISPSYFYAGSGVMILTDQVGAYPTTCGISTAVAFEGAIFAPSAAAPVDIAAVQNVVLSCCPSSLPTILELSHNLNGLLPFSNFLMRNGFTLPGSLLRNVSTTFVLLNYSAVTGSWKGNLHYSGLSAVNSGNETWDILFEFACVTSVAITQLSQSAWKFSMLITTKNSLTGSRFLVRFLVVFAAGTVCPDDRVFDEFELTYDIQNQVVEPSDIQNVVFYDNEGMFASSPAFAGNPLEIIIQSQQGAPPSNTIDQPLTRQLYTTEFVP